LNGYLEHIMIYFGWT